MDLLPTVNVDVISSVFAVFFVGLASLWGISRAIKLASEH